MAFGFGRKELNFTLSPVWLTHYVLNWVCEAQIVNIFSFVGHGLVAAK